MSRKGKTMNNVKAIPVTYRGIQFRSKLEAKVALFLDECGIEYQYEPDSFADDKNGYMPDFYLPNSDAYIEVKGKRPGYGTEILKAISFVGDKIKILIIISQIPDMDQRGWPHFPCVYNGGVLGVCFGWWFFHDDGEPHISRARYPRPPINPATGAMYIDPVSDWYLRRCSDNATLLEELDKHLTNEDIEWITQQEARERWAKEDDHWPFDNFNDYYREIYVDIKDIANFRTVKAFKKARAERFDEWLDKKRKR